MYLWQHCVRSIAGGVIQGCGGGMSPLKIWRRCKHLEALEASSGGMLHRAALTRLKPDQPGGPETLREYNTTKQTQAQRVWWKQSWA